jgi:uncharacterized SAM-binding protein YcdF (DUF218 family)
VFFFLSKTLGTALLPVNFLIGLGLVGAILLFTRWARLGRRLALVSAVVLAIAGFSPLGKLMLYPLEQRFPPWDASRGSPDGIVVLGGAIDPDRSAEKGGAVLSRAADRIVAAAALARQYPGARIVFSGGNGNLLSDNSAKEADYAQSVLESLGVSRARLTIERQSRNTLENAEYSKAVANAKVGERWLLVTSAFHMPRAIGLFRKAGFAVEPYPVDWRVGRADLMRFSSISIEGLERTDTAVREWLGLAAYWATGKIDSLLPGRPVATTGQSG